MLYNNFHEHADDHKYLIHGNKSSASVESTAAADDVKFFFHYYALCFSLARSFIVWVIKSQHSESVLYVCIHLTTHSNLYYPIL